MCTSLAPTRRRVFTLVLAVVPLMMESSIIRTRLSLSSSFTGFSFTLTPKSLMLWEG